MGADRTLIQVKVRCGLGRVGVLGRLYGNSRGMSASLIGRLGSSAFRLSTTTVSMSLAGSCFSSESAPGPLYGAFFVKKFARAANLLSFVSFFVRSQSPFLRPDPPVR
jgi:hypothetical protein